MTIAVTRQALGILVESRKTHGTLSTGKVRQTSTLSCNVANRRCASSPGAVTRLTIGIVEVSGNTLITPRSSVAFTAKTLSVAFVTNFVQGAANIAVTVCTRRVVEETILAFIAMLTSEIRFTLTLAGSEVTYITNGANFVASTRFTIREVVITVGTLLTMITAEVWLAWTLPVDGLAVIANSSVQIALARPAVRISEVTVRTGITVRWVELRSTFATTSFFLAVSGGVEVIAVARLTNIRFIPVLSVWAVERVLAFVAVDTLGMVLTVLADATSFVVAVDIQRQVLLVDLIGVDTLSCMAVAVTWFTLEWTSIRVLVPLLLFETWTTLCTLNTTSVVLTLTRQNTFRRAWI